MIITMNMTTAMAIDVPMACIIMRIVVLLRSDEVGTLRGNQCQWGQWSQAQVFRLSHKLVAKLSPCLLTRIRTICCKTSCLCSSLLGKWRMPRSQQAIWWNSAHLGQPGWLLDHLCT